MTLHFAKTSTLQYLKWSRSHMSEVYRNLLIVFEIFRGKNSLPSGQGRWYWFLLWLGCEERSDSESVQTDEKGERQAEMGCSEWPASMPSWPLNTNQCWTGKLCAHAEGGWGAFAGPVRGQRADKSYGVGTGWAEKSCRRLAFGRRKGGFLQHQDWLKEVGRVLVFHSCCYLINLVCVVIPGVIFSCSLSFSHRSNTRRQEN